MNFLKRLFGRKPEAKPHAEIVDNVSELVDEAPETKPEPKEQRHITYKSELTKKQQKARIRGKMARKSRKINYKKARSK